MGIKTKAKHVPASRAETPFRGYEDLESMKAERTSEADHLYEETASCEEASPAYGSKTTIIDSVTSSTNTMGLPSLIAAVKSGFPVSELRALQTNLGIPMDHLAPRLGISRATLHRRLIAGHLDAGESDRVIRYARLMGKAAEVLETKAAAQAWLDTPQLALGGEKPLDFAMTELGAREVERLLGRIDHSVYS